jgi:Icc-related predicted phosphoesterase
VWRVVQLLPRRTFLHNKTLPLVVGHDRLDEQIRRIQSRVHVFGHTHIDKDKTIDGVRYVQVRPAHCPSFFVVLPIHANTCREDRMPLGTPPKGSSHGAS